MQSLNFPKATLKLTQNNSSLYVWCPLRRKNLLLTPEEWVRQHAIHFMVSILKIPQGRIASEHTVKINGQNRRCDLLVISGDGKPQLIVECKAPEIQLTERTFLQTSHYISVLQAPYFMMTNGLTHVMAKIEGTEIVYLSAIPPYSQW